MKNGVKKIISNLPRRALKKIRRLTQDGESFSPHRKRIQEAFELYERKGVIFIHIPKAAGVSVFHAIYDQDSWGHAPISDFIEIIGLEKVKNIPKFCFVRDPYFRLYSAYQYLSAGGRGKGQDIARQEILRPFEGFEGFIKDFLPTEEAMKIIHFKPQKYWVVDRAGKLSVDYIGRFEEIDKSYAEMSSIFQIEASPLPRLNRNPKYEIASSNEERVRKIYNDTMLSIVNKVYEDDFETFGYPILKG